MAEKVRYIINFFKESKNELKKVTWPVRREVLMTTIAVLVFSFIIAFLLGLFDYLYGLLMGIFFK